MNAVFIIRVKLGYVALRGFNVGLGFIPKDDPETCHRNFDPRRREFSNKDVAEREKEVSEFYRRTLIAPAFNLQDVYKKLILHLFNTSTMIFLFWSHVVY